MVASVVETGVMGRREVFTAVDVNSGMRIVDPVSIVMPARIAGLTGSAGGAWTFEPRKP